MVSAAGLAHGSVPTARLLETMPGEGDVAMQIFGADEREAAVAARIVSEAAQRAQGGRIVELNLNAGCPVPKVVNNREGSALMRDPKLAGQIVRTMADRLHKPVTVKIRKGFGADEETAPELAKVLEDNGAAAIAVHGRTREQFYSGKADWRTIAKVKRAVSYRVSSKEMPCSRKACTQPWWRRREVSE
jgi:tRNA-dihydrouridine synthase